MAFVNLEDTIAAVSTPVGSGGIGIVRISGKDAVPLADRLFQSPRQIKLSEKKTHTVSYGKIINTDTKAIVDEVLVTVMRAPNTYTTEDVVEINCHGGYFVTNEVLALVLKNGARLAEPGEFTKRAFLNGRIDLTQAEAVMDLIQAKTELSRQAASGQLSGKLRDKRCV